MLEGHLSQELVGQDPIGLPPREGKSQRELQRQELAKLLDSPMDSEVGLGSLFRC